MLSDSERKQLTRLKQDLQDVRQLATDMHGLGQAVGGSLLQGEPHAGTAPAQSDGCHRWQLGAEASGMLAAVVSSIFLVAINAAGSLTALLFCAPLVVLQACSRSSATR